MINKQKNTILNILLYNSFMTLKPKYMLNLTSSDKTSETLPPTCKCSHFRLDFLGICWCTSPYLYSSAWVFSFSLVRPIDHQWRWLAEIFYSKWYCAMSEDDVLARRFKLASNRYIVYGSVNVKYVSTKYR